MSVTKQVGKRPSNAIAERISVYEHDTIIFTGATGAKIVATDLFTSPKKRSPVLQSNAFPLGVGRALKLVGMKIEHNIKFNTPAETHLFETFSRIGFDLDDTIYSPIHISDFLPYNRAALGSVEAATTPVDTNYTVLSKGGSYSKLARPIIIPETGSVGMRFLPAADLTTANVTVENGAVKFGAGIVDGEDTPCFFFKVTFVGELLRETSRQLHAPVR